MKDLYPIAGISKQAMHKYRLRDFYMQQVVEQVVSECTEIREGHRRMSCRKMYHKSKDKVPVGRDIFEQIGFANGFKVRVIRSKQKTTWATKQQVYPNLIEGLEINGINQVWQSDIFYLAVGQQHFYGVTIIDVYSRRLLAVHLSDNMLAAQVVKALKKAIKKRKGYIIAGCIFHSDFGSQYISQILKELIAFYEMRQSMSKLPQENAYAERVQGTIKHEYLETLNLTQENLQLSAEKVMRLYNEERPHNELGKRTPAEFEEYINTLSPEECPKLTIYKWTHPLLTNTININKKKKEPKKKKSTSSSN
jgi:putative transposase